MQMEEYCMFIFDEDTIRALFDSSLKDAKARLASLKICCSDEPKFNGLDGWLFEQTIQHCLRKELKERGLQPEIKEQVNLGGRARADLVVGAVALEIKKSGLFQREAAGRYRKYRSAAGKKDYSYFYLTLHETYRPYREAVEKALGEQNAFFLDRPGEWQRFVKRIVEELKRQEMP